MQHLWIQVGTPGGQTSFLTGFVMVYTERCQPKKPLKEPPYHVPRLRCRRCRNSPGADLATRSQSGSGRSLWRGAEAEGSCPAQRSPGRRCLRPRNSTQRRPRQSYADVRQLKTTWPHVGLRLPAKEQGSERRLGAARPAARCWAAGRQRGHRRLPWSSGGDTG